MSNLGTTSTPWKALRLFVIIILLVAAGAGVGLYLTRVRFFAAPEQPFEYSHQAHTDAGIQCLYCHSQATRSQIAGIPSVERCMGCHKEIVSESEAIEALVGYWEQGEAIPWAAVNVQPDFVYFSHQPHLAAGINCENCHGFVSQLDEARPALRMDMGWCLDCHTEQEPKHVARLADCTACHK